jgi:hypothetical protein
MEPFRLGQTQSDGHTLETEVCGMDTGQSTDADTAKASDVVKQLDLVLLTKRSQSAYQDWLYDTKTEMDDELSMMQIRQAINDVSSVKV